MVFSRELNSLSLGHHAGYLRDLSHRVKSGEFGAICKAADLMSSYISSDCILVPIPQHSGDAEYTYELCSCLSYLTGARVVDALMGFYRASCHDLKKKGRKVKDVLFFKGDVLDTRKKVFLVDNTVDTGNNAFAARKALGFNAPLITITNAKRK